jgi:methylglutaconyl-CoA hydratase
MQQGTVSSKIEHNITTITFSHPAHNAMPGHQLAALSDAITEAGRDAECKVIILQSGGNRTFCAGASFDELVAIHDEGTGREFFMGFANVINACRKCPRLIVGRVQGKAVGGGVGIAAAVDYCFATKYASVKLSELALGIGPFVVGPAVERKIGTSAFSLLSVNATDWQSAQWAHSQGLFMEVFDSTDAMDERVHAFAAGLAGMSLDAMTELKRVLWEETEDWDTLLEERAGISGKLVLSEFTKSTIAAIKAKSS